MQNAKKAFGNLHMHYANTYMHKRHSMYVCDITAWTELARGEVNWLVIVRHLIGMLPLHPDGQERSQIAIIHKSCTRIQTHVHSHMLCTHTNTCTHTNIHIRTPCTCSGYVYSQGTSITI